MTCNGNCKQGRRCGCGTQRNLERELAAERAKVATLREALLGVIRVADRKTDEFDAARAALEGA